jgi:predicted HTH domain antitoxin
MWRSHCAFREVSSMAKTTIEIPDDRLEDLDAYRDRLGEILLLGLSQIKIQEALVLYRRGLVSMGRAAELAVISESGMVQQARAAGIHPRWSELQAEAELA